MVQPGEAAQNPRSAWGRINWFKYSSPQTFFPLAGDAAPWFAVAAALFCAVGLYVGFFVAPTDQQQGEAYRIIFIHVPAAWMSMFIYLVMAFWAGMGLVLNTRLSGMMANALAPTGALFTFVALWTGALWGKPTWGTWWVWDADFSPDDRQMRGRGDWGRGVPYGVAIALGGSLVLWTRVVGVPTLRSLPL